METTTTTASVIDQRKEQHKLLLLKLVGNLTGDLWHLAAAMVLYQAVETALIEATPVAAVSVIEYTWVINKAERAKAEAMPNGSKEEKVARKAALAKCGAYGTSHFLTRGIVSFEYLRSIQAPTLLVRLAQLSTTGDLSIETYKKVAGDYVVRREPIQGPQSVEEYKNATGNWVVDTSKGIPGHYVVKGLFEVLAQTQKSDWRSVYDRTEETKFEFRPEKMPAYPAAGVGVNDVWKRSNQQPAPPTLGLQDIMAKARHDPAQIWDCNQDLRNGPFVATTIVMMYLKDPATRAERTRMLQQNLAGAENGQQWQQAKELTGKLMKIYNDNGKRRLLLFNYRLGDVNRQHDANLALFEEARGLAAGVSKKRDLLCVPIFVGTGDAEANAVKERCGDNWIQLYAPGVNYDKRYTAAFWTMVANTMSDQVFGLIGGRSGSMDIASFMGVNCCQWDEPLCDPDLARLYLEQGYVNENVDQCLRLFNQIWNMSIAYVNPKSRVTFAETHGKYEQVMENNVKVNCYTKFIEKHIEDWLDRAPDITRATVYPAFPTVQDGDRTIIDMSKYNNGPTFRTLVTIALNKLENDEAKISAVALRQMGFDRTILLANETPAGTEEKPTVPDKSASAPKKQPAKPKQPTRTAEEWKQFNAKQQEIQKQTEAAALQALQAQTATADPQPTSTQAQVIATLTGPEALLQTAVGESEDAGDVANPDPFLAKTGQSPH